MKNITNISKTQENAIQWFFKNPPRYYVWFYKFYKKWLTKIVIGVIALAGLLILLNNNKLFAIIKGLFFMGFGLVLYSLSGFLYKHFYTKRYAKKIGMSLEEWNAEVEGLFWDI